MRINKKILIFAVIIGLITVFGLSYYLKNQSSTATAAQVSYSKVVVANNIIPENIKITAEMVTLKSVPSNTVHPQSFSAADKVIGKTTSSQIEKDEQLLSSRLVTDTSKASLAYKIPEKMRAVTIPCNEITGVAGYINAGDKIDILITYNKKEVNKVSTTYTVLQNIEVAEVGSSVKSSDNNQKSLPASITLFVKPAQAEVLVYAISNGSISMTLRNPVDKATLSGSYYNSDNFASYTGR